ncbi:nonsense-mediated mRNA decay protein [Rhodotorula toruloides]|uniref:Nonsense-mediated mRNA decay protein n=1 Tax=Rhodotorula toruloides TaxID=5286 RepID=A0A511KA65_RHOTO|nr:nonsense-mediated mRNA decay protein [Rhodotorula toruloides]
MDAQRLYQVFTASFEPDPNIRIAAELELKKLEPVEGLLPTLLQLISPSSSSSSVVRLAAAIYFKNRIRSSWRSPLEPSPFASPAAVAAAQKASIFVAIPASDRQSVKSSLIPLYAALAADPSSSKVKEQIGEVLSKVIECDFPAEWPGLVDEVKTMLAGNEGQIEAGLRVAMEVLNCLRYAHKDETGETLPHLTTHLLPLLLPIGQKVIASSPSEAAAFTTQGTLLRLVLKSYKNSIIHTLTPAHQAHDSLIPWGTLLLSVVAHPINASLLPEDEDAREKHPWAKSKKWACWSLNKLFTRYGSPTQLPKNMVEQYGQFANRFVEQFAPEIMKTYLAAVEKMVAHNEWFPRKGKFHILCFFEECINPKSTFALLKPHIPSLIEHFIFPLVCLSEEEIELFSEDPTEFSRQFFGDFIADSYASPTASALAFLAALTETRAKTTLLSLLQFIQSVVDKYPAETTPRQKDGALRMLAALAPTAVKSKKLAPLLESFFLQHVVPEFKSPHGLLRYRACDVIEKFESVDMTWAAQDALENTLNLLMNCITDTDLPVRIQAAIALPELVRYERIREKMLPNLGRILQELLKLSSEVDLDSLTNTTRSMVSEFSDEVVPFAVELSHSLVESYRRLLQETLETRDKDPSGIDTYDDEKTMVMMNVLKTIEQLISSAREKKELVAEIEKAVVPLIEATIRHSVVELYDEAYEILDSLTFFQQAISPPMWACFEATCGALKKDAGDYLHETFGFIDNCINYGVDILSTNTEYRRAIIELFDTCMTSRALGAEDRVIACKLAEALLLRLRGQVDEALPPVIERCMWFVLKHDEDEDFVVTKTLFMHALELVVLAISYNPQLTIAILDRHDWTQQFFAHWFKNLSKYSRVHDKKIILWAICTLFDWLNGPGAASPLKGNVGQLVAGALEVFKTYPSALAERKVAEEARDLEEEEVDDDMSDDEDLDLGEDDGDFDDADVRDRTTDYLDQLAQSEANRLARGGAFDDGDSAWSDEILWASPLDQFDSYQRFSGLLANLQTANPSLYQSSLSALDASQRGVLADVASKAAEGGDAVVAAKAYAELQAEEGSAA